MPLPRTMVIYIHILPHSLCTFVNCINVKDRRQWIVVSSFFHCSLIHQSSNVTRVTLLLSFPFHFWFTQAWKVKDFSFSRTIVRYIVPFPIFLFIKESNYKDVCSFLDNILLCLSLVIINIYENNLLYPCCSLFWFYLW